MKEEIIIKALLKIIKEQKKTREDIDYIINFLSLLNDKIDVIIKK